MSSLSTIHPTALLPLPDSSKEKFLERVRESLLSGQPALIIPSGGSRIVTEDEGSSKILANNVLYPAVNESFGPEVIADGLYNPSEDTISSMEQDEVNKKITLDLYVKFIETMAEFLDYEAENLLKEIWENSGAAGLGVPQPYDMSVDAPPYSNKQSSHNERHGAGSFTAQDDLQSKLNYGKDFFDLSDEQYYDFLLFSNQGKEFVEILIDTIELLNLSIPFVIPSLTPAGSPEKQIEAIEKLVESVTTPTGMIELVYQPVFDFVMMGLNQRHPDPVILEEPTNYSIYTATLSFGVAFAVLAIIGKLFGTGAIASQIADIFEII